MTVQISIEIDEYAREFAEEQVRQGHFPDLSSVFAAGLEQMMLDAEDATDPLAGMADEIRSRMELPRDQWIPWDGEELLAAIKMKRDR